jgi:outer membrane lipoprotein-sorting protein
MLSSSPAICAVDAKEVESLMHIIEQSMFPQIAASSVKITSYKDAVEQKVIAFELLSSGDKGLIEFTAPTVDKGKYILSSGKNLWMYFSDIKRSIRLSYQDSFMGTDANNYDVLQLNLIQDYSVVGFEETTLEGKPAIKLELSAREGTEGYKKITSWVDQKGRRLLQNDCFSISGEKIKTIKYQETKLIDRYQVPVSVLIENHLDKSRTTRMEFVNVEPRDKFNEAIFTLGYLESMN